MGNGTLTIYSASAGSGKTYKLTGIYLTNLFKSRYYYRKILAVTFTHKATAEMKSRILENLHKLAVGKESEYLKDLIIETGRNEQWLRNEAKEILNAILHDFSRFNVSTIDSFFQKVLRAFTREAGLHSGFTVELDHDTILSSAVDEMIASASDDSQLKNWLTRYAMSNIDDEKSWNLKDAIIRMSEELFKEKFKILSVDERKKLEDKTFLLQYMEKIRAVSLAFENELKVYGKRANDLFIKFSLTEDMFYRKGQGVPRFLNILLSGTATVINNYIREIENIPPRWSTGEPSPQLQAALIEGLDNILISAINYYDNNIINYNSARAVLSNIYALGILPDILKNVHLITNSENQFLLSDAGEFLNLITGGEQSPFIYEKVGNQYEIFMIDEFQDTSEIQWNNFNPLIGNSMAEGHDNLVVGDVKQSIYRWRNSDWKILGSFLKRKIDNERFISKPLTTNWRSRSNIIKFNNRLFTVIPEQVDEALSVDSFHVSFKELYSEAVQADPGRKEGGYVRLEFVPDEKEMDWENAVLERLPSIIESFQEKGYKASDIGIIVRESREGAEVLKTIIDYSNNCSPEKKNKFNFNVVSNDSLLLSNSPVISFIIAVLTVVNEPSDMISRARMLRMFFLAKGRDDAHKTSLNSDSLIEVSGTCFPDGYQDFLNSLKQVPLFEATEGIISFFGLGEFSSNVAYLNTFQDFVVSFSGSKSADIQSFLDWWDTTGYRKSVVLPDNQDAIRILTIHKSKGLEFKVVILPFISWHVDHNQAKQPVLWVKPSYPPFNELGIVPVKYGKDLADTIFADDYKTEKYSVYLDNLNLLYVAFTRAKDAIYGFSVDNRSVESSVAGILKNAFTQRSVSDDSSDLSLNNLYDSENRIFEFGEIPVSKCELSDNVSIMTSSYKVSHEMESLKLKLHGANYFSSEMEEVRKKINYGKLMHEVFEGIITQADIPRVLQKMVLEGKLNEAESSEIERKIRTLIAEAPVSDWFKPGNIVMPEGAILTPSGNTRRPDRVIVMDGKTIIIDFKFGEENPHYREQVNQYKYLLLNMGYTGIEAFIWYVDKNLIVSV